MTKLPDDTKQMEFANGFAARFPTLAGKEQPVMTKPEAPEPNQPAQEEAPKDSAEIAVSLAPHQLRRARARAAALDAQTGVSKEPKAFAPRWAVLTSMPARCPKTNEITRSIGDGLAVHFVAAKDTGLPYGQDRLLPIFVASAYAALGYPEDRIITFRSLSVIRDLFSIREEGAAVRVRAGLLRWGRTAIHLTTTTIDARTGVRRTVGELNSLLSAYVLYSDEHKPNQYTVFENAVKLSEWSAANVEKSSVPVRLGLVRVLRDNPGALSLALWSGYRANGVRRAGEVRVPIFGPDGLAAQLGYTEEEPRETRRQLARHLAQVKAEWRDCPHEIQRDEFIVRAYKTPPLELPPEFVAGLRRATPATLDALERPTLVGKPARKR